MPSFVRYLIITLVATAAITSLFIIRTNDRAGEFTTLVPRFGGECRTLAGFVGAEDFALDAESGVLYAAGEDRRAKRAGDDTRGAVWALAWDDLDAASPDDLTDGEPADFHPLGVDLHIAQDGTRRLFVANRADAGHRLDIFRVTPAGRLDHERSFEDPALKNVNDVLALGTDRAYVTLDKNAPTGSLGEVIEGALERANGRVALISSDGVEIVADGLIYANGLGLTSDGETLIVAETVGRAITLYGRDPQTDALTRRERVLIGTGVDNITRDDSGRFFIAAHPKTLTFATSHARKAGKLSPSQVIVVDAVNQTADQLFLSLGQDLSGSSAAIVDIAARRMVIGSVYEPHILACDLPEVWRHSEAYPTPQPPSR